MNGGPAGLPIARKTLPPAPGPLCCPEPRAELLGALPSAGVNEDEREKVETAPASTVAVMEVSPEELEARRQRQSEQGRAAALSRSAQEKARKARLQARDEQRRRREAQVLSAAAAGHSLSAIARQLGISQPYVSQLYHRAMKRVEGEHVEAYRSVAMHRLGLLHQAAWAEAMDPELPASVRSQARRDALAIEAEMTKVQGAYAPQQVEIAGELDIREFSLAEALAAAREIQAERISRGEAELPGGLEAEELDELGGPILEAEVLDVEPLELEPPPAGGNGASSNGRSNGHSSPGSNGHGELGEAAA